VARFRDKPLEFQPGEKWNYSNSGYVLLTYLIEKISGMSYEKFVRENIFVPLKMQDSGYDSNSAVIPHRASGYTRNNDKFENAGFIHMSVPQGAGALYSTTEDLLKWEQSLFGGKVLRSASLEKMTARPLCGKAASLVGNERKDAARGVHFLNRILAPALSYPPEAALASLPL
jgi:CubicO group peptidase (beta-lactamase class C family)